MQELKKFFEYQSNLEITSVKYLEISKSGSTYAGFKQFLLDIMFSSPISVSYKIFHIQRPT